MASQWCPRIGILRYFFEKLLPPDCEALQQTLTGRAAGSGSSILDNPMDVGEEQLKRILMKLAWLKTVDGSRIIQEEARQKVIPFVISSALFSKL